jgi:polyvinyl alcohol dehydrogenase (cytochrome)
MGSFLKAHGRGFALLLAACSSLWPASAVWAAQCNGTIDRASPTLQNGFAGDLRNSRQTVSSITAGNVDRLRLAVAHSADGGKKEKRGAPAVTQQAVFFSAGRDVVAMNRISGCIYWSYTIPAKTTLLVGSNAVRSSAIYYLNESPPKPALVFAGDFFGNLYALDAVTGKLAWSRFIGTEKDHHMITGAPQVAAGKLLVPVATKEVLSAVVETLRTCCSSHGLLQALDPYTGNPLWTYHTSAEARYNATTNTRAPNGMSLWGAPAVDVGRGLVYVGTAQNLTAPSTDNSDAIIALDLQTGAQRWVFQSTAGDVYNIGCELVPPLNWDCSQPRGGDFDFGAPPILVTLQNGQGALIAGAKNGVVYSLNPDTGALNWSRRLGQGAELGGVHWGMAVDAQKVYVAITDATVNKASAVPALGLLQSSKIALVENATPGLYALDLATGALVWEQHPQHASDGVMVDSIYSAALNVTNDVLFAGSLDGVVKAFRTADGSELWAADTAVSFTDVNGNKGQGGGIDSVGPIAAGTDLLVNSGYDTFGGVNAYHAGPGNALFIYRLN